MKIDGTTCLVTGAGGGIGAALARRLHTVGAGHVIVSDKDGDAARRVARDIGATAIACDVADAGALTAMADRALADHGRVDILCSNAGILRTDTDAGVASLSVSAFCTSTSSAVRSVTTAAAPASASAMASTPSPSSATSFFSLFFSFFSPFFSFFSFFFFLRNSRRFEKLAINISTVKHKTQTAHVCQISMNFLS